MRTKKQEYFDSIKKYIADFSDMNGYAPSMSEIAEGIGLPKYTVGRYMIAMREQGIIVYSGAKSASVTNISSRTIRVPVLGTVSCGVSKLAEENIEEYVRLPVALFGSGSFYLLRANGDSMIDAGINDGDIVLIRQQNHADAGQIVVALVDDEATLKRF